MQLNRLLVLATRIEPRTQTAIPAMRELIESEFAKLARRGIFSFTYYNCLTGQFRSLTRGSIGCGTEQSERTRWVKFDQTVDVFAHLFGQAHAGRLDLATNSDPRSVDCFCDSWFESCVPAP